jgi:hypothetical protein
MTLISIYHFYLIINLLIFISYIILVLYVIQKNMHIRKLLQIINFDFSKFNFFTSLTNKTLNLIISLKIILEIF